MSLNTRLLLISNGLSGKNWVLDAFGRAGAEWVLPAMFGWLAVTAFIRYERQYLALVMIGVTFAIVAALGILCSLLIGGIVREKRPYVALPNHVRPLFTTFSSWKSFPSDHSLIAFLIVEIAYCYQLPGMVGLMIFALWVALGRVYAGVHYPIDILGGAVLSVLVMLTYALAFLAPVMAVVSKYGPHLWGG